MICRNDNEPLEEIRQIRDQLAKEANYDVHQAFLQIRATPSVEVLLERFRNEAASSVSLEEILSAPEFTVEDLPSDDDPLVELRRIRAELAAERGLGTTAKKQSDRDAWRVAEDAGEFGARPDGPTPPDEGK